MNTFLQILFLSIFFVFYPCDGLKPGGRNVCEKKVPYSVQEVVYFMTSVTTYYQDCCKKVFAKCVKTCSKPRTSQVKRSKVAVVGKIRSEYFCCSGWTNKNSQECSYPVCSRKCIPGNCVGPNRCQINYDANIGFEQDVLKQSACGSEIINIAGTISHVGAGENAITSSQSCQWKIIIPYNQRTRFTFTSFRLPTFMRCADSVVTISTSKLNYLFCSERPPTIGKGLDFDDQTFYVNIVQNRWSRSQGFTLQFKDAFS